MKFGIIILGMIIATSSVAEQPEISMDMPQPSYCTASISMSASGPGFSLDSYEYIDDDCMKLQKLRSIAIFCDNNPTQCTKQEVTIMGMDLSIDVPNKDSSFYMMDDKPNNS